jgi:histidyl-tRNA synthetase
VGAFVRIDPGIVRGLAYYTGTVFEFFSLGKGMRALAGGGRYDQLCGLMSGGAVDLPAVGFAMGDVVLGDLIRETPGAQARLEAWVEAACGVDVWVVVADEARRAAALEVLHAVRQAGWRADMALGPAKVAKQFQAAEGARARVAIVVGSEYPLLKLKDLASRTELPAEPGNWLASVTHLLTPTPVPT